MLHLSIKRFILICVCAAVYGAVFHSLFMSALASTPASETAVKPSASTVQPEVDSPIGDTFTPLANADMKKSKAINHSYESNEPPRTTDPTILSGEVALETSCDNTPSTDASPKDSFSTDISGPMGEYGRLSIPDLGYSARLSSQAADPYGDGQWIVDEYDHALVCNYAPNYIDGGLLLIADHNTDGFSAIQKAVPGVTTCQIKHIDGTVSSYVCTKKFSGHNTTEYVTDSDYHLVTGNSNQIGMYTCNDNWHDVTIVIWDKV